LEPSAIPLGLLCARERAGIRTCERRVGERGERGRVVRIAIQDREQLLELIGHQVPGLMLLA
jgi:hypothetical protein